MTGDRAGLVSRSFQGPSDGAIITELLSKIHSSTPHAIDCAWRFSAIDPEHFNHSRLWFDQGRLVALASWQLPWATLDVFILPGLTETNWDREVITWALGLFETMDANRGFPLPYWINIPAGDDQRLDQLERHGFTMQNRAPDIVLERNLQVPLTDSVVPEGYTIRQIASDAELEEYVVAHRSAFGSESMNVNWRRRVTEFPGYIPALDLVAVNRDGEVVGFCVGWLSADRAVGQIEPLGVIPHHRRRGVANSLLNEMLSRFEHLGAQRVIVLAEAHNADAQRTYNSVGFVQSGEIISRGRFV